MGGVVRMRSFTRENLLVLFSSCRCRRGLQVEKVVGIAVDGAWRQCEDPSFTRLITGEIYEYCFRAAGVGEAYRSETSLVAHSECYE
jgi:hypothetical protein